MKIKSCDYIGKYQGYEIYRCYAKDLPNYKNIVFVKGYDMYLNGNVVGQLDDQYRVCNWHIPEEKKVSSGNKPVLTEVVNAEEIISNSWKRSINDLVGRKFSE